MISDFINNKIKNTFHSETLNDIKCILCKRDVVSICRYCFFISLIRILRELNFSEKLIENFGYNPLYGEDYLENESMPAIKMKMK